MPQVSAICPKCGATVSVDAGVEASICTVCGAPFVTQKAAEEYIARRNAATAGRTADEADRTFVLTHLIDGVRDNPKYYENNFNKKQYEAAFFQFKRDRMPTYEAMDRYVLANPMQRDALLNEFADRFVADWAALYPGKKTGRAAFAGKMVLALFEVPAILHMGLSCSMDYCSLLERKFNERYPDNMFHVGSYEELAAGFARKKVCFITTAVCEFEGKADDCAELTAFRAFRDGWMMENGDAPLIEEYYEIAPAIVTAMDYCTDRETGYRVLRRDYLTPCYAALQRGDMEACRSRYIEMVRSLKTRFGLN